MFKLIFDLSTGPLGLPINDLWEYIILSIIGLIAFSVGWEVSPGGKFGSIIHWVVRLLVFFALWAITYGVIAAFQWFIAHWVLVLAVLGGIVVLLIAVFVVKRKLFKEQKE